MSLHWISEEKLNEFLGTMDEINIGIEDTGKLGIALGKLLGHEITHLCLSSKEIEGGLICRQNKNEQKSCT